MTHTDEALVESVLTEFRREMPDSVRSLSHRFDTDAAGEDAVFIVLNVADQLKPSRHEVRHLVDFSDRIRQRLLSRHIHAWPYLSVVDAA
ncbi:hypothetical protein [Sphaerotilus sp.]|uniref:hypothetical protein n=1 Tax=Sphaerotilus sp. TaxID=2093942 RepID=UPI002ACEA532|nr:hypothetical protein [Sphaerotilus sp.]MDZ7858218.1 hypothetical protein [Sphaerotilus sp.]